MKNFDIRRKAYFVVLTDAVTGEYRECDIWSSPPWEQSMLPKGVIAGVYAEAIGDTYQEAFDCLRNDLAYRVAYGLKIWTRLTKNWRSGATRFNELVEERKEWEKSRLQKSAAGSSPEPFISGNSSEPST